jgi:hypothetical protein
MGFSSQSGQVGFGIQSVKGTAVAATRFARLRGGSMGGERSLLIPDAEIGGGRDIPQAYLGSVGFMGDLEFYPRAQMLAMLLFGASGTKASTTVAGPPLKGTHVITPGNALPWLTVEERIGQTFESFRYTDAKVNSLKLEAEANGYLMGSANLIALKGVSGFNAQSTPTYDESPLTVGSSVVFTVGGVDLKAKSFSLELTNNIESDDFRLGSVYMADAVEKRRELKMTASYRPDDSTLWKQAMWGSGSATEAAAGAAYRGAVTVTITSYETIGAEVGGVPFSIAFNIPYAVLEPFKVSPSGDDVIGTDISLTAIRPVTATPLYTATIVNDLSTVS